MKFIFGGLALMLLVCAVTYYGSIKNFNPDAEGKKARETIKSGMSWEEVTQATTTPLKYRVLVPDPDHKESLEPGFEQKFETGAFKALVAKGTASHGFIFEYTYSDREQFNVNFGPDGKVESITQRLGMADLLQQR